MQTFQDDDVGYEAWLTAHPSGWVVNARRSPSPAYLKLHRAKCVTISQPQAGYSRWTSGGYIKICADHRDQLDDWAQRTLGANLQDGCHCVQDGTRARAVLAASRPVVRPVVVAAVASGAPMAIDAEGYWTVETPRLIPFEPRDGTLVEGRAAMRRMLGKLVAKPGELLHGVVEGPTVTGTDLDNALLYNIGGSMNASARYGVSLERRIAAPGTGTRYRYRLTSDPDVPSLDGEILVALDGVSLGRAPRAWHDIWMAVRISDAVKVLASAPGGEVGLHLRVGAPRFAGAANGQFVKTMVDGLVTALHVHADQSSATVVADRLATMIPLSADEIAALLLNNERAALGTCKRLVVLRGNGVQCQPQDGRVAALRIEIDRSATTWQLSGQIVRRQSGQ